MNNKINSSPENQETPQEFFKSLLGENSPDYIDLERVVIETAPEISWTRTWEKLKKFTRIKNGNVEGIYWEGDLNFSWSIITSLGKIKKVDGSLILYGVSKLTDLGFLEVVGGNLDLRGTNVKIRLEVSKKIRENKIKVGNLIYDYDYLIKSKALKLI